MHRTFEKKPTASDGAQGGLEALKSQGPLSIKAFQYDITCDGQEIASGGIRRLDPAALRRLIRIRNAGSFWMTESTQQMDERLCGVIAAARFEALSQPYGWQLVSQLSQLPTTALAAVRDGSAWYALTPVSPDAPGAYRMLVFHFAEGSNASGFVAWLAGFMKKEAGTGAMVVCGFDARATPALWQTSLGLFDYWGCPWNRGDEVAALVKRLRREGSHGR